MKKIILSAISALTVFALISCATTVSSKVMRPAELDMHGAKTIAVLPFQEYAPASISTSSPDAKARTECVDHISTELEERLADVEYYTLESSARVRVAIEKGRPSPAEVYITGYINTFSDKIEVEEKTTVVNDEERIEKTYIRKVNAEIIYQIIDAVTNVVIHKDYKTISDSAMAYSQKDLKSAYALIADELDDFVTMLLKKIQPYEETVSYSLLKDKTKNPDMKLADKLAKAGQIESACEKYLAVYESTGDFVAGYNSAILYEAAGDLYKARSLMEELVKSTADNRAVKALKNINKEIESLERLEQQNADRDL